MADTRVNARTNHLKVSISSMLHKYSPLSHQFFPVFFSVRASHRSIILLRDHRENFCREPCERGVRAHTVHSLGNPLALLGRNIRGRKNPLGWINQEEDEDSSVTGSGGILQVEWLDLMLIQVRKGNTSMSFGDNVTDILH